MGRISVVFENPFHFGSARHEVVFATNTQIWRFWYQKLAACSFSGTGEERMSIIDFGARFSCVGD